MSSVRRLLGRLAIPHCDGMHVPYLEICRRCLPNPAGLGREMALEAGPRSSSESTRETSGRPRAMASSRVDGEQNTTASINMPRTYDSGRQEVQPGGGRGREVEKDPRVGFRLRPYRWTLLGGAVVDDDVHVQDPVGPKTLGALLIRNSWGEEWGTGDTGGCPIGM